MAPTEHSGRSRVVAALLVQNNTILLCHRSPDRRWYPDVWDLPGGHIEGDETPTAALVRELHEELGVIPLEPLGPRSFHHATDEFEMWAWIVRHWTGTLANCAADEHDAIGWFSERQAGALKLADSTYQNWIVAALETK